MIKDSRRWLPSLCLFISLFTVLTIVSTQVCANNSYLQVGVFRKQDNAQQMLRYLEHITDYPVTIQRKEHQHKPLYTLVIEGFKTESAAQKLQYSLKKQGYVSLLKQHTKVHKPYRFMPNPAVEEATVSTAYQELGVAIKDPEYLLKNDLHLPTSPEIKSRQPIQMSIREAIFLALRYSEDVENAELNRIVSRYQLRIEQNAFELQYALNGTNSFAWTKSNGVHSKPYPSQSWRLNPSISRTNKWGGVSTVTMNNSYNGTIYSPELALSYKQSLLRGADSEVVQQTLHNQLDNEISNKLSLKQTYVDKVTTVVNAYRQLIQQKNTYITAEKSLKDAKYTLWVNKKKIEAGELEPTGNIQQEYQVANLSVSLASQLNSYVQSKRSFLQSIGLDPGMNINVPSDVEVTGSSLKVPDVDETVKYALAHNTKYLSSLIQYRIKRRALRAAQNSQLWQLDFSAEKTYGSTAALSRDKGLKNMTNGRNQAFTMGLTLSVPINDLKNRSLVISSKVALEQARLSLLAEKRQLITQVMNQIETIRTSLSLYKMNVKQLELAQRSYDIELKKRNAGFSSALNVTNTQNQLIDARNSLISTKISFLSGVASLQQILGTTLEEWKIKVRFA